MLHDSSVIYKRYHQFHEIFILKLGVDPKSVFCAFFKQGLCKKGDKCKFSHDPAVERKSAKRNIYADERDGKENDNMDDWDDETLADVIAKKHGSEKSNQTDIVRLTFTVHNS